MRRKGWMPNYKRSPCLYYSKVLDFRQGLFDIFVKNQHCGQIPRISFVKLDGEYTLRNYSNRHLTREIVRTSHEPASFFFVSCIFSAAQTGVRAISTEPHRQIISPICAPRSTGAVRKGGSTAVTVYAGGLPYHAVIFGASRI